MKIIFRENFAKVPRSIRENLTSADKPMGLGNNISLFSSDLLFSLLSTSDSDWGSCKKTSLWQRKIGYLISIYLIKRYAQSVVHCGRLKFSIGPVKDWLN